jgi:hypothetical protein
LPDPAVSSALFAKALGVDFVEGDEYYPVENVRRMSSGIPLTDEDCAGWLNRSPCDFVKRRMPAPAWSGLLGPQTIVPRYPRAGASRRRSGSATFEALDHRAALTDRLAMSGG